MAPNSVLCAAALLLVGSVAAVCQQASPAPAIVQPGAPGEASKALTSVTAAPPAKPPTEADIRFMQDMIMHHGQAVEMTELAKTRAADAAVKEMAAKIDLSQGDEIRWMKQWLAERGIAPEAMGDMPGMQMAPSAPPPTVQPDGTPVTHLGHENSSHTAHTNNIAPPAEHAGTDHDDMAGMDMAGTDHDAAPAKGAAPVKKVDPMDTAMMPGMLTPRQMTALRAANGKQFDRLFLTGMMQHHNGALLMVKDLFQQPGAGQDPQLFDFATDVDNTQLAEIDIMKGILRKVNP